MFYHIVLRLGFVAFSAVCCGKDGSPTWKIMCSKQIYYNTERGTSVLRLTFAAPSSSVLFCVKLHLAVVFGLRAWFPLRTKHTSRGWQWDMRRRMGEMEKESINTIFFTGVNVTLLTSMENNITHTSSIRKKHKLVSMWEQDCIQVTTQVSHESDGLQITLKVNVFKMLTIQSP